jgi:pre-mRNA-splicing factor CWC22
MLENPTEDSVEIACDFMTECGQVLSELTPAGVNAIFERFKGILHEGEIDRRVQYSIESLFATRKSKFASHPGVIPELDLVEEEDQITHQISLDDDIVGEENLNIFKFDQFFDKTELEWNEIKKEILGEDNILKLKTLQPNELEEEKEEEEEEQKIEDLTEADRVHLKRTVYLTIVNSVDFEECAHKLLKMELGQGHEDEV